MTLAKNNQVISLGCRLNLFEAELIKGILKDNGMKNTIVVNTCTVTSEAHRQSIQTIRKLKRENPNCKIIVTGCAVETEDLKAQVPIIDHIVKNKDKLSSKAFRSLQNTEASTSIQESYQIPKLHGFTDRTRAFVQIQQGCDHRCTFCIIHKARGKSLSLSQESIIAQIKQLNDFGHKEIVLTGVDISSWQRDDHIYGKSKLGELCMAILKHVPSLQRLRLSSLDPAVKDENIATLLKNEERFMPHLHLSLQSMSNNVLRNMGRRHNKETATSWINELKEANPNTTFGADIICGFPRETDEQFLDTMNSLLELKIAFLHIFPYSQRHNTPAAKMAQLPQYIKKQRAYSLKQVAEKIKRDLFIHKLGNKECILIEANNKGYTKDYCATQILGNIIPKSNIVDVTVVGYNAKNLIAEPITPIQ